VLGGYFSKDLRRHIKNFERAITLGTSWWNENNRQFELHIELAAVSDANVPARMSGEMRN
jgi:hypothetical protein